MGAAELFCRAWQFLAAIYALYRRWRKEVSQSGSVATIFPGVGLFDWPGGRKMSDIISSGFIRVEPTVVSNPSGVKEDYSADMLRDYLRAALKSAGFEIGDSPVKAHLVLDEFTSGSTAKRVMVGFGAGRSTVDTRLVVVDGEKEAASVRIRVRGNLIFSPYEGGNTQRRKSVNSLQQRVLEEIYKLK